MCALCALCALPVRRRVHDWVCQQYAAVGEASLQAQPPPERVVPHQLHVVPVLVMLRSTCCWVSIVGFSVLSTYTYVSAEWCEGSM